MGQGLRRLPVLSLCTPSLLALFLLLLRVTRPPPALLRPSRDGLFFLLTASHQEETVFALSSWLSREEHVVAAFAGRRGELLRLPARPSRAPWLALRFSLCMLSSSPQWLLVVSSSNFVRVPLLAALLAPLRPERPALVSLGHQVADPLLALNSRALTQLRKRIASGEESCHPLHGSLEACLGEKFLVDLSFDAEGRQRFIRMDRHFAVSEMKEYLASHPSYDTGQAEIERISADLVSFHELRAEEHSLLRLFLHRLRVSPLE